MIMYAEGMSRISAGKAFLNPKARFLRDLSTAIAAVAAKKGASVLDATAGTGIRGIRYMLETRAKSLTMLDMNRDAYASAKKNAALNHVRADVIHTSLQEFANSGRKSFDLIDVDPFGGLSPYVYDTMKLAKDGTLLMLTATDTAVLCGAHEAACLKIYGARPMHNELCHEVGVRILISYVAGTASQFNSGLDVIAAVSYAHYMRVLLRLRHGSGRALSTVKSAGYAHYCQRCGWRGTERGFVSRLAACPVCGAAVTTAGRLWLGNLYDKALLGKALGRFSASGYGAEGAQTLAAMAGELDVPLFYSIPRTTKMMRVPSVAPSRVIDALRSSGRLATGTHFDPGGVKTDAGIDEVKAAVRASNK